MKKFKDLMLEAADKADVISMSVPLFIRMLEWAREEAKTDVELHLATERAIRKGGVLDTTDYEELVEKTGGD
jgi:hypothetical protein